MIQPDQYLGAVAEGLLVVAGQVHSGDNDDHVLAVGVQPAQGVQGGGGVTGGQLAHQVGGFHAARKAQGV